MTQKNQTFLSVAETAEYLGISRPSVYKLLKKRKLPFYEFAGCTKLKMRDVYKFVQRSRVLSEPEMDTPDEPTCTNS